MSYIGSRSSLNMIQLPRTRYLVLIAMGFLLVLVGTFLFQATTVYPSQVISKAAGEAIGLNPLDDRVDFGDVSQGAAVAKTLVFNNEGTVPNMVRIIVMGSVGDLVDVSDNSFTLEPGEEKKVRFQLLMPPSAPVEKTYSGRVIVVRLPLRPF